MKTLNLFTEIAVILALTLLGVSSAKADLNCRLAAEKDGQTLHRCAVPESSKEFFVLNLHGGIAETAYYHGLFLANEIQDGVLGGIAEQEKRALFSLSDSQRKLALQLKDCLINHYANGTSDEFIRMNREMARGMRDAGVTVSDDEVLTANLAIELSISLDAFGRNLQKHPTRTKAEIVALCGPHFVVQGIEHLLGRIASPDKTTKMGCTGVAASSAITKDGDLVHGRNFDTTLIGYVDRYPLVTVQTFPNGTQVTTMAAAGIHYGGGITGFNSHGLSISVHELYTDLPVIYKDYRTSDMTPFLAHRILAEAKTLDEAIRLVKKTGGFGAWTLLISDTKTDEVASVEINGYTQVVARRIRHDGLGQSNHFLDPSTRRHGYESSFNKTLESESRLFQVTDALKKDRGAIDAAWAINLLSGHEDYFVGMRSFGRTTTKVYTATTHVMIPAKHQFWMSLSDRYPTTASHFVGMELQDAPKGTLPLRLIGVTEAARRPGLENWYASQEHYVRAFLDYSDSFNLIANIEATLMQLDTAIALAQQDGITDFPYHFMKMRVLIWLAAHDRPQADARLADAQNEIQLLRDASHSGLLTLHRYEVAQLDLWQSRITDLQGAAADKASAEITTRNATKGLQALLANHPGNWDLNLLLWSLEEPYTWEKAIKEPLQFATVE